VRAEAKQVQYLGVEAVQPAADVAGEEVVPSAAHADRAVGELLREGAVPGIEPLRGVGEGEVETAAAGGAAERVEGCAPGVEARRGCGGTQSSIPRSGEEGTATPLAGMRPPRQESRPASTARRIARAMRTGSVAPAMALLSSTASTPCSIA